jgi:FlaG/FlaF family flagellin (archaellin)
MMMMVNLQLASFSIISIMIILDGSVLSTAQGQANVTSSLTPQQKAAICNPNDVHINTTESKICGKPVTIKPHTSNTTSTANTTTTSENTTSPSILPLLVP